jgi:hypothetical protein
MINRILEVGRDRRGLFYNWIEPQSGRHSDELTDNWGYDLNGVYTVYLIDNTAVYRNAVQYALANLYSSYSHYAWESGSADGYADSIEGAINLYNREPMPDVPKWIDGQTRIMWNIQKPDGTIEGWHGDGNFARTTIMYCLWKTKGLTIQPWRDDVAFGAVQDGDTLRISLRSDSDWEGKLIFDTPRHQTIMKMPLDWPRINQFPEWFTVKAGQRYMVHDLATNSKRAYTAEQLHAGIPITLERRTELRLRVQ